jgi:hypothetical protein
MINEMNTPPTIIDQLNYKLNRQKLSNARIQLHYAIQPLAATSLALVKEQTDFSHMALQWDDRFGFITQGINTAKSYRIALDPATLTLEFIGDNDQVISVFALGDRTLSEGFDWIRTVIKGLGGAAELITPISYPPDDFPDSDLARSDTFSLQFPTSSLADYYASANQVLQALTESEPLASPVRIWPHHFDIATLISIPSEINREEKTIGVGLSPGDSSYTEPYWYVTPYPYPENRENLPILAGNGFWHTSGWVGAVLTASQFASPTSSPNASIDQIKTFVNSAIAACKDLLS